MRRRGQPPSVGAAWAFATPGAFAVVELHLDWDGELI